MGYCSRFTKEKKNLVFKRRIRKEILRDLNPDKTTEERRGKKKSPSFYRIPSEIIKNGMQKEKRSVLLSKSPSIGPAR